MNARTNHYRVPIGLVARLTIMLIRDNIRSWLLLALTLHFLCFSFILFLDVVPTYFRVVYAIDMRKFDTIVLLSNGLQSFSFSNLTFGATFGTNMFVTNLLPLMICVYVVYLVVLKVASSKIVYQSISGGSANMNSDRLLRYIQEVDARFAPAKFISSSAVLVYSRVFAIFIVYVLLFVMYLEVGIRIIPLLDHLPGFYVRVSFGVLFSIVSLVVVSFLLSRWALAVSVTIHENRGVLSSILRSWKMTQANKMRMFWLNLGAYVVAALVLYIFTIPVTILGSSSLLAFVLWVFGLIISPLVPTVLISVIYCAIRLELKPARSDKSSPGQTLG